MLPTVVKLLIFVFARESGPSFSSPLGGQGKTQTEIKMLSAKVLRKGSLKIHQSSLHEKCNDSA